MDEFEMIMALVAVGGAAWMLGYSAGRRRWHAKFVVLGELSLKLIKAIEEQEKNTK